MLHRSAFHEGCQHPSASRPEDVRREVIAIVLFAAGIVWLLRAGGRGPAIYLGVLFALEIVGNFTIFDVLGDLRHEGSWTDFATGVGYTVATVVGLVACLVLAASPSRAAAAETVRT